MASNRFHRDFPRLAAVVIVAGAILVASSGAHSALAGSPLFKGGFMGLNLAPATSHTHARTPSFAGSLGLRLSPQWRVGAEISYTARRHPRGGETVSRLSMLNVYYDIDLGSSRFQPFLTIGAGLASHDFYRGGTDGRGLGVGMATDTSITPAWQAGGGLNYRINDNLSLSGGYRHVDFSAADGHELRMGVNWKLPVRRNIGGPGAR